MDGIDALSWSVSQIKLHAVNSSDKINRSPVGSFFVFVWVFLPGRNLDKDGQSFFNYLNRINLKPTHRCLWVAGVCRIGPVGDLVSPPQRQRPLCWHAGCTWSSGPWAWLCSLVRAPERHTQGRLIISYPVLRQLLSRWSVIIWVLLSRCALFVVQILPLCDFMAASAV